MTPPAATRPTATVGLLHTSPLHVPVLEALLVAALPGVRTRHVVDADLLARAQRSDPATDPGLAADLAARLAEAGADADVVLCTCSTLGVAAEAAGPDLGVAVVRTDRALAERAVALAAAAGARRGRPGRIGVVTAVASTVGPTRALLEDVAAAAGAEVRLVERPVPAAWPLFEAGDLAGYHARLAAHLAEVDAEVDAGPDAGPDAGLDGGEPLADVVLLAQASMAPAADLVETRAPVLVGAGPAVADLVRRLGERA